MEAEIVLRSCVPQDFESLLGLLARLAPESALDAGLLRRSYFRGFETGAVRYVGAFVPEAMLGFGAISVRHGLWSSDCLGHVDELVVDDAGRRQGIGTRLLQAAEVVAREMGCTRIELDSGFHREEAHQFYAGLGYERRAVLFSKSLLPTEPSLSE